MNTENDPPSNLGSGTSLPYTSPVSPQSEYIEPILDVTVHPVSAPVVDDDSFDIVNDIVEDDNETTAPTLTDDDEDDVVPSGEVDEGPTREADEVLYPEDKIDLRGEDREKLADLLAADEQAIGPVLLDSNVRMVGSWENLIFRAVTDPSHEEIRIQEALASLSAEDRAALNRRYRNPETGKVLLQTSPISGSSPSAGETKDLTGDAALIAFETVGTAKGGGYRIPLYNSGVTIDVIVPTGNDIQTMLSNCVAVDRELGSSTGAHYFAYADIMYKTQILNFIQPLIVNSSYSDWRKNGALWKIIKITDLEAIVMTIAAICYKNGFDGFVNRCSRPITDEHKELCTHTEKITANLFDMIITRWSAMSAESIDFMVQSRLGVNRNSLTKIAKYQADLGLEGEQITFGDMTFTMRIPSIAEYMEAGGRFLQDIINEIGGDNTDGQYEQLGFRYIRTFLPWIATVERTGQNKETIRTAEPRTITRELEKIDKNHPEKLRTALRHYVNKIQLTYVGYPVTECPKCGHMADTPSGMWTIDPFSAFFTLAFLYLIPTE